MLPEHSQKAFWIYEFSSKHVSVWCQKKIFALHPFVMPQNCILEALWKQISIYFYISPYENVRSRDVVRFYLLGDGLGGGWIVLKAAHFYVPRKMIYNFSFWLKFLKIQLYFSISILLSIALKRWNFRDNLEFKGKIVVKFLRRSHFLLM